MSKGKCDSFYFLAKKHGFRSRAAFKLIEIEKKYKIIKKSKGILDLCAGPGSWTQVANKISPLGSLIIGIDAQKIKPIKNCYFLRGDITSPSIIKAISRLKKIDGRKIDLVLHDGAPKIGTSWLKDVLNQNELVLLALKMSVSTLEKGGNFISKIFQSEFLHGILYISYCFFEKISLFKPSASRNSSTEIYLICKKFKAPKKFDPFFFSSDYIFSFLQFKVLKEGENKGLKKKFSCSSGKNFLKILRNYTHENFYENINFRIKDDELGVTFGISLFSKIFVRENMKSFQEVEENQIILKWSQRLLLIQ